MTFCQILSIELIKAIPIFIIGLITGYIAWRQYKIEKTRLTTELFRNKYIVFKEINKIRWEMIHDSSHEKQNLLEFTESILHRHFIFSRELNSKLQHLEYLLSSLNLEYIAYKMSGSTEQIKKYKNEIIDESKIIMEDIIRESKI